MKTILLTNDDGYESPGLLALKEALSPLGRVVVVAPATEKSACAHSLTLTRPLRFIQIDDDFFKLNDGTPSDCIYLALYSMFELEKPDLIVSGINHGANMGEDITYSGTAAGAMEGVLQGVPSIAISQVLNSANRDQIDFTLAQEAIGHIASKLLKHNPLPRRQFLNINVPNGAHSVAYETTYAGYRNYGNDAHLHRNPRGEEHYWLGLHPLDFDVRPEHQPLLSDYEAVMQGRVSITPVMLDLTAYESMSKVKHWL